MNHKQQLFANACLRLTDPLVAYIQAYKPKDASNYRSIKSAANRLLRHPEIAAHISGVRNAALEQAQYELKEQMKEELLSVHDKRLYIKRVINGEIFIPYDYKAKGCNLCTVLLRPTFPQILGYLKEDSRLAGHYPGKQPRPRQQPATTTDKKLLTVSPIKGERGTLAQDTPPQEQQSATNCPLLAGVSRSDGGGTLAPDSREEQQTTTTERSELVATTKKDINKATTDNKTLKPLTKEMSPFGGSGRSAEEGGTPAFTPTEGRGQVQPAPDKPKRTTSHAGLQKLWNKQRQRAGKLVTKQGKLTGI